MKTILKETAKLFLLLSLIFMVGCDSEDEDISYTPNTNTTSVNPYGKWKRGDGVNGYLKFAGSVATTCNNGTSTTGTFNASEPSMTFVVQGETIKFPLQFKANNSLLVGVPQQAITTNNATLYYRSEQFPCGGGNGGGSSTTGNVMFWKSSDLGCGAITVTLNGQSSSMSGYYPSGTPNCGASYSANFTLPVGTYNFTASCTSYNWSGSVTVSADGCSKMRLYI